MPQIFFSAVALGSLFQVFRSIFSHRQRGRLSKCSYRRWIEKAAVKDGIERTRLHKPRHTAISLLLKRGADPFAVQNPAGHSDVRLTTQTYAHVQADALKRAARVLDRIGVAEKAGGYPLANNDRLRGKRLVNPRRL